jgi:hypothetical protein
LVEQLEGKQMANGTKETKGTKALAFQQPWATLIMTGEKTIECRSRNIKTPVKNLLGCASKTATAFLPFPGLAYGYAMALVDVVACVPFKKKHLEASCMEMMPGKEDNAWILENPRPVKPFPVHATASFFYVQDKIELVTIESPDDYIALYSDIWNSKPDKLGELTIEQVISDFFA